MLLPSSGEPVMTPTLDMVLGCYYLTNIRPGAKGEGMLFSNFEEAKLACDLDIVSLAAEIEVKSDTESGGRLKTSVGRILFNDVLPEEFRFYNKTSDKAALKRLVSECYHLLGNEATVTMLDNLKSIGFEYATKSGTSIAARDVESPRDKAKLLEEGDERIAVIESQFNRGLITDDERYSNAIQIWTETTDKIKETISQSLDRYGGIYMMASSGAKGNISQITQMAGMRGLMTDPSGRIIDFPIKSSFREGLSVMEYFISTHGARKGLADTALRTSDAGYLTRRLIDVAQDLIILQDDCGTEEGIWLTEKQEKGLLSSLYDRMVGRLAATEIVHPATGEVIVPRNEEIDEEKAKYILELGITQVHIRSPLCCHAKRGICQYCYGRDLTRRGLVEMSTAVGIIAAQSIGEPGTQLTLRTFHTGGVVGADITSGLPRVEELFEARVPKGVSILAEIDGTVEISNVQDIRKIIITNAESYLDEYQLPPGTKAAITSGEWIEAGTSLITPIEQKADETEDKEEQPVAEDNHQLIARVDGHVVIEDESLYIQYDEKEEREYVIPAGSHIRVKSGDVVKAGDQLLDGAIDPQDILRIMGREAVQQYLVDEVQKVYRSQGVNISDKHIEVIIRQMLRRVRIESPGDTELLTGDLIDRFDYESVNAKVLAEGGEPATAQTVLLGITRASLNTSSWLAAASFQETTKVLTEAAIWGKTDKLLGLKENVIIGRLIPAQALQPEDLEELAEEAEVAFGDEEGLPPVSDEIGLLGEPALPMTADEALSMLDGTTSVATIEEEAPEDTVPDEEIPTAEVKEEPDS
jgi:DNA-directed RNA polymerase subunit beta'